MRTVPDRRRSPLVLLLALAVAIVGPVVAATATGLATGPAAHDVAMAPGGDEGGDEGRDGGTSGSPAGKDAGAGPDAAPGDPGGTSPDGESGGAPSTTTTTAVDDGATASTTVLAPSTTAAPRNPTTTSTPDTQPSAPEPAAPTGGEMAAKVVDLANAARKHRGCGPLEIDDRLVFAAYLHSVDMATNDYFSHDSLDGSSFADRLTAVGYPDPGGENIAQGQPSAQAVHDAWMASKAHRANILNCDFTAVGVGVHVASSTWTQDFGY